MERLQIKLFDAQRTQEQWGDLGGRNPGLVDSASELRSRDQQRDMRVLVLHSAISRRRSISRRDHTLHPRRIVEMPVFEPLDDTADCLVSKDKALFKTT
jgi:hypothetical protein